MGRPAHRPEFSIITPAHNSEKFIAFAVESVSAQSFPDFEHIVVDDGSRDCTWEVIRCYAASDSRIRPFRLERSRGAAFARNKAISEANGRYIAFLDDDDIWYPNKLLRQLSVLKHGSPFVFSGYDVISEEGEKIGTRSVPVGVSYHQILSHNVIGTLTAVYDSNYFGKVFMPDIKKRQDLGLWLRLLRDDRRAHGIQESLGSYRVRKGSISSNKMDASRYTWRLYREIERMSVPTALYYFGQYAFLGLGRSLREKTAARRVNQPRQR